MTTTLPGTPAAEGAGLVSNTSSAVLQSGEAITFQPAMGTLVVCASNAGTNPGDLVVTTGGAPPLSIQVPAAAPLPTVLAVETGGAVTVTNTSPTQTSILASAGPVTGATPVKLPVGTPVTLPSGTSAQGSVSAQDMQLQMQAASPGLVVLAVVGSGGEAYALALNAPSSTGPGTGVTPPSGYYATTVQNTYAFDFNWGAGTVSVSNLYARMSASATVTLREL